MECLITELRGILEAKGVSIEAIYDKLEEIVTYARKVLSIGTENYKSKLRTHMF